MLRRQNGVDVTLRTNPGPSNKKDRSPHDIKHLERCWGRCPFTTVICGPASC